MKKGDRIICVGAKVRLNSGGPWMLVVDTCPISKRCVVSWKDGNGDVHEDSLPYECVTWVGGPFPTRRA